jgi:cell division protein FtsI/penicillin-binding protein 2
MGAAFLAGEIGSERFRNYFLNLGFGEKTGIDLPSETSGLIRNLESPRQIEYATAAFGQGIAVTPVEMIRALATLANGGKSVTPHLGKSVRLTSGVTRTLTFPEGQQVFSPEATREVSKMLTYVVDHDLSKGKVRIPSYSVAAKTGTAQLTDEKGGYYKDRYFHSFFGYFPAHEPRFIILLYTNDPKGVAYASETLTTTFIDLVHFLIEYYDIPPDREAAAV